MSKPLANRHSTRPAHYFEHRPQPEVQWSNPTWLERNGELIVACLGAVVILFALGSIGYALAMSVIQ